MTYNEFNARGLAYPVIELSKEQIEKLEQLIGFDIDTNDDISDGISVLIDALIDIC